MSLLVTKSVEDGFNATGAASLRLSIPIADAQIGCRASAAKVDPLISFHQLLSSDCNLNLDARFDVDNYLLDNLRRCVEARFETTH